jgi:hypothetical protein
VFYVLQEGLQENKHEYTYFPVQSVNENESQTQLLDKNPGETSERQNALSFDLASFCQKDFDPWLKFEGQPLLYTQCSILQINGSPIKITEEQFKEKIQSLQPCVCSSDSERKISDISENKPKTVDKQKMSLECLSLEKQQTTNTNINDGKPVYRFKLIPMGEKCKQCENFAVQYVIEHKSQAERLCETCFKRRRENFTNAHWIPINGVS